MIPLPPFSQKSLVVTAIAAASIMLGGLLFFKTPAPLVNALSSSSSQTNAANTVYLSSNAATTTKSVDTPIQEVHIANTGLILLRGARVLSVSGSTIEVGMTWDSSEFTWSVQTNFSTKFMNAKGEKESVTTIHIGDVVTVTGNVVRGGMRPIINANIVRK